MTRRSLPHGSRHGSGHGSTAHHHAKPGSGERPARGNPFDAPELHADGHDHIGGGGGSSVALGGLPGAMIALTDGTRIMFVATCAIPQF